jgi:hypothetical protein
MVLDSPAKAIGQEKEGKGKWVGNAEAYCLYSQTLTSSAEQL